MINFDNAELLSLNQTNRFFQAGLRYGVSKDINVAGYVLDLTNQDGVSGIWSGEEVLIRGATDYHPVLLNGIYFGSGKVLNFNFDAGNDVRVKRYNCTLRVLETGNLSNATGYYSGIDFANYGLLENLSESIDFAYNGGVPQYQHSIDVQFNSGANVTNPRTLAQNLASGLFSHLNLTGFLGDYLNVQNYRRFFTENYDLVSNRCNFAYTFDARVSGNYSFTYNTSVQTSEDGFSTVQENGVVVGLVYPYYNNAFTGFNTENANAFARCGQVFDVYKPSGAGALINQPIQKTQTLNQYAAQIDYQIAFSNNPKYNATYSWEYTQQVTRETNRAFTISEDGNVIGLGRGLVDKYNNAVNGYAIVKTGISGRCTGLYYSEVGGTSTLNLINSSEQKDQFLGTIGYSRTFTDDLSYLNVSGIKQALIEVNDTFPVRKVNIVPIFNRNEIVQDGGIATLGNRGLSIKLKGARNLGYTGYLAYAKAVAYGYNPTGLGADVYINSVDTRLDPFENNFDLTLGWTYHRTGVTLTGLMPYI